MSTDALRTTATNLFPGSKPLSAVTSEVGMMSCDTCDLAGGPFPAAEAAHLRGVHNRLHHGMISAA